MLSYDDIPRAFNVAAYFLDRPLEQGWGERTALICEGRRTTYALLAQLSNRAGHVLRDLGVRAEERVLLVLGDCVEFVAVWYGALKIGAVTAEAYTFLPAKDYAYYLDYTRAGVVVADGTTLARVREAAASSRWLRHVLVTGVAPGELDGPRERSLDAALAAAPAELEPAPTTRDDVAIWKFTTGSTGAPKAAVHPHHSPMLSFDWYARGVLGLRADDIVLPVPKLFFGYARDLTALYPFGVGAAGIVFAERSTPDTLFALIARERPTVLVQVPTMIRQMLDHAAAAEQDFSSLRFCTSAGEALPEPLHRAWLDTFGVEVLDGMGSSEAYHIYVSNRPGQARPGTLGQVVPGYRARVVDADGAEVADGETGELWIEGDTAAMLYFNEHAKTKRTFAGDIVRTGDLVARDGDGFLSYRGRADDLLKVGGIWVAPAEVEGCLAEHPAVRECAVVGYEEAGLTRARAWVALQPGAQADAQELEGWARERLAPHKRPRDVRFTDALPRTGAGKVDRQALRASE